MYTSEKSIVFGGTVMMSLTCTMFSWLPKCRSSLISRRIRLRRAPGPVAVAVAVARARRRGGPRLASTRSEKTLAIFLIATRRPVAVSSAEHTTP